MNTQTDEFAQWYQSRFYPKAFLERHEPVRCLSSSENGETLLVRERRGNARRIAKINEGGEGGVDGATLCALEHPNLPKTREVIRDGDTQILIREYVEGQPLDEIASQRRLSISEVISVGTQLCSALNYLHAQNPPIIHRDVKPHNVIVGADGKATLIDFGIARVYKRDANSDTAFAGTSGFAPPEQYGFRQTDARADIYALGVLMRFIATGGNPQGIISDKRLRRVVARCTAFTPYLRYPTALAVKRALLGVDGRRTRRLTVIAAVLAALCCGFVLGCYALAYIPQARPAAFIEPVVEKAARIALDMPQGELTPESLETVSALYIVGDEAQGNSQDFFAANSAWESRGRPVGNSLRTLDDLARFKGLQTLYIASGDYTSIGALANCPELRHIELYGNDALTDISAISALEQLRYIGFISCNRISDISPIIGRAHLTDLDLTGFQTSYDPSVLARLGDLGSLALGGSVGAYRYLGGKRIGCLRLFNSDIDSLEPLRTVTGLYSLDLSGTPILSLEGIEAHGGLSDLNIARTAVSDLKPLLALPNLARLALSEDMKTDASVLEGRAGLTVRYE